MKQGRKKIGNNYRLPIAVSIDKDILLQIDTICIKFGISRSQIFNEALVLYLKRLKRRGVIDDREKTGQGESNGKS